MPKGNKKSAAAAKKTELASGSAPRAKRKSGLGGLKNLFSGTPVAWDAGQGTALGAARPQPVTPPPPVLARPMELIADLATCLWDIERKIRPEAGEAVSMKLKIAHRRAQRGLENLSQGGIRVQDFKVGEPFGGGNRGLKVHLEPTEGAKSETISDTVSPTIYFKDVPIQMGEVWVAIPLAYVEAETAPAEPAKPPPPVESAETGAVKDTATTGKLPNSQCIQEVNQRPI